MLTDLGIKKLALPEQRREIPDGKIGGLYLIHQPSGVKSWAVRYRFAGAPKKLTLGPYPALDLATARRRAQEALGDVAGGKDPSALKQAAKAAVKAERENEHDRIERVVPLFVDRYAKAKNRDWRETERMLDREVVARWRGRRLSTLTRGKIHEMLDEIADRAPIRANRVFAAFRKLCRWSLARGLIDRDPCAGISAPSPERSRDRVLDDAEIKLAWQAFEAIGWPFGPICKLLALTGARLGEVGGMRWSELDLAARVWRLPAARVKNARAHEIPLSDAAVEIIQGLPHIGDVKDGYVFTTTGRTAVSGFSRAKRAIDRTILELMKEEAEARGDDADSVTPPPPWRLHDLRRSAASGMAGLGVAPHIVEACLNHKSGVIRGVASVYNRYDYAVEKRAALDAWARRLEAIVSGAAPLNIVALASARG
jgi:integrase